MNTALRKRVIDLLADISDDYIEEVLHFLENIKIKDEQEEQDRKERQEAYNRLEKYFGKLKCDMDYKKELQEILIEKYNNLN